MLSDSSSKVKSDCPTLGFPIFFNELYEVKEETDTSDAPLIPSAAPLGVMSNLCIDNQSCNEIVAVVEFWSSAADCDGCTKDVPITEQQKITIPPNKKWTDVGNWVDYEIVGGVFVQDGCVVVSGSRLLSTCCKWTGLTSSTNGLEIPTI